MFQQDMLITFDDVLIKPRFSMARSRKDVELASYLWDAHFKLPIMSANMDTITNSAMALAMAEGGGIGCLHRFQSIEENVAMLKQSIHKQTNLVPVVSIGLGTKELERAEALYHAGAQTVIVDVAHGANIAVVEHVAELKKLLKDNVCVIVGNFGCSEAIKDFKHHLGNDYVLGWKVGIGPGSACTTRLKTGIGVPQLSAILDCAQNIPEAIIADGGLRSSGDIAKALAAGADLVMLGGMLAGTKETPGEIESDEHCNHYKKYRGSASKESYAAQGKDQGYITAEGESFTVPYKGSVLPILADIEGGLRSTMTYVGAMTLSEFPERCILQQVSPATALENGAHGKKS